jgi:type II secretory pathway pseudopilin PulG
MSDPQPRSNRPLLIVIIVLLLVILCGGTVPVVGILAAIAIPNFVVMQSRAKRAEVPVNVDGIKTAEIAYEAAFDTFVPVTEPVPVQAWEVGRELHAWPVGTRFDDLGWSADGMVRGTYWVEVSPDGEDFTVYGICDVDGDGDAATFTATREQHATLQTYDRTY